MWNADTIMITRLKPNPEAICSSASASLADQSVCSGGVPRSSDPCLDKGHNDRPLGIVGFSKLSPSRRKDGTAQTNGEVKHREPQRKD